MDATKIDAGTAKAVMDFTGSVLNVIAGLLVLIGAILTIDQRKENKANKAAARNKTIGQKGNNFRTGLVIFNFLLMFGGACGIVFEVMNVSVCCFIASIFVYVLFFLQGQSQPNRRNIAVLVLYSFCMSFSAMICAIRFFVETHK